MSGRVSLALRVLVRDRAHGRCEYCLIRDEDVLAPHEPDHIIAEQHGGQADANNLAYACAQCNRYKGSNIASLDPETRERVFLFHPREDEWSDHFRLEGALVVALTAKGRATVALLKINSALRTGDRELLSLAGTYPG